MTNKIKKQEANLKAKIEAYSRFVDRVTRASDMRNNRKGIWKGLSIYQSL